MALATPDRRLRRTRIFILKPNDIVEYFNIVMGCSVTSIEDCILVMAAFCYYISYEEIFLLFPTLSFHYVANLFSLLRKKTFLVDAPLGKRDGSTKKVFMITPKGHKTARFYFNNMLTHKMEEARRFPSKDSPKIYHDYSVGYNFVLMLSLGLCIEWEREVEHIRSHGSRHNYFYSSDNSSYIIRSDADCYVCKDFNDYHKRLIYFEQDMLTEDSSILADKILNYHDSGLMDNSRNFIVFSIKKAKYSIEPNNRYVKNDVFSIEKCEHLLDSFRILHEENAVDLLNEPDISIEDKKYIYRLLKVIGANLYEIPIHGEGYVVSDVTLSEEFVEAYLKTLKNHTNKYKLEQLNREHYFQTTKRFAAVRSALQDKNCPAFFEGFQILFLPTPLISNSIPYAMLYEFPDKVRQLEKYLDVYFRNIQFESEVSKIGFSLPNCYEVHLRNSFVYPYLEGYEQKYGHVFVEFPYMDLGASYRIMELNNHILNYPSNHVVCVFDTIEQIKKYDVIIDNKPVTDIRKNGGGFYMLLRKDRGFENHLYRFCFNRTIF